MTVAAEYHHQPYPTEFPIDCITALIRSIRNGDFQSNIKLNVKHALHVLNYAAGVAIGEPDADHDTPDNPPIWTGSQPAEIPADVNECCDRLEVLCQAATGPGAKEIPLDLLMPLITWLLQFLQNLRK